MALIASRALVVVLSSPPAVLDFCGGCAVPCLLSLALGWVHFWPAVSTAPVRCEVCSLGCPSWLVLLFLSPFVLHLLLQWGGLVTGLWPLLLLLCVGFLWGLCCAVMSPWPMVAPFPSVVSCLGFLPLAFVRTWVGRLRSCLLLGGNSPSLVLVVFAWQFLQFGCPGSLSFLELVTGVLSSRFQCLLIARGGCGWSLVIRPPWLGGGRCYPGFLSGTCRLALVGLRCLWVPRSCGVPGLRDGVTCLRSGLCSSSVRDHNEDFPSFWGVWFLAFVRGPLPQAGAVFFGMR